MIVRFDNKALKELKSAHSIGVEGDSETLKGGMSEADAIVSSIKKLQEETGESAVSEKIGANTAGSMIVEEEEQDAEPGPELSVEGLEEAKAKNKS
jgi:protein phosphatase PTC1